MEGAVEEWADVAETGINRKRRHRTAIPLFGQQFGGAPQRTFGSAHSFWEAIDQEQDVRRPLGNGYGISLRYLEALGKCMHRTPCMFFIDF